MVSTRNKRQSNKRLLSQLDDYDRDMIIGNDVSERQENAVVNEGTNDRDFTVGTSSNDSIVNGNAMSVKTLERCFNERIDREMSNINDTVEDRIQNAILAAIDNIVTPKIELAIGPINASSGRDATSVSANSERREHVGINASFENASENNNTLGVSNVNDETRHDIQDEVSELSVPETKPVSTNTLIFDGKNEKFELFEDLFHTMFKKQPEMTEAMKINLFHAHLRKEALQTFRNISALNKKTLDDVLIVFRRKYVKPESQATAKHKWHKLTFDHNKKSLPDVLEELNECAERAFGDNTQHMIDSVLYAKLPPHLKRSLNLAYLENGTYDQIIAHLEKELELSGLENDGELTMPTMTAVPPNDNQQNTEQTRVICHSCKKPGHVIRECRKRMRKEQEQRNDPPNQNIKPSTSKSFPPCPHCQRTNHPPEKCWSGPNAANRPKRFKQEYHPENLNDGQEQGNLTHSGPSSILKNSLK